MTATKAITGLEFVRNFFTYFPESPVEKLLEITKGETEYLELKASCCFDKSAPGNKSYETQDDLSWNIARELFALYNSKGGALIIGIDDKTFEPVSLPKYGSMPVNDYIKRMVIDKIFHGDFRWAVKNGSEIYQCDNGKASAFLADNLRGEISSYRKNPVVVLFVEPAKCREGECIQICIMKNRGDQYDQMPVREPGCTGGVKAITRDKGKKEHEATRHNTDRELGRLWERIAPKPTNRGRDDVLTTAAADDSSLDADPLIRAIEGQDLYTQFGPGMNIGPYKVLRKIGEGGMGIVYEVEHPTLRIRRALKVFAPEEDDDLLKRKFVTEARMLAELSHPNLVKAYALNVAGNTATLCYEMDLVTGDNGKTSTLKSVFERLQDNKPTQRRLRIWFAQLCSVLEYIHARQVLHRDIKLENILLDRDDNAMLSDFGIARIRDQELKARLGDDRTMNPTAAGRGDAGIGTAEYIAPELEHEKATAKSDVYALGVVFYKLVTGRCYNRETGKDLEIRLKSAAPFWRKTLPKLLSGFPCRLDSLSRYASVPRYPGLGFTEHLLRAAWPCALLLATSAFLAGMIFTGKAQPQSVNRPTADELRSESESAASSVPPSEHTDDGRGDCPFNRQELKQAESDVQHLWGTNIPEMRTIILGGRPKHSSTENDERDTVSTEMDAIHAKLYQINIGLNHFNSLGMKIDEVLATQRHFTIECAEIRRGINERMNKLIAEKKHSLALQYYNEVSAEFRNCRLTRVPRPDFARNK